MCAILLCLHVVQCLMERVSMSRWVPWQSFTYESSSTIDIVHRDMDMLAVLKGNFVSQHVIRDNVMIYLLEL